MRLTIKEEAKVIAALMFEKHTTPYKNEFDYIDYIDYLISLFYGAEVKPNSGIPNPKRHITLRKRILNVYENQIKKAFEDGDRMDYIYNRYIIRINKKINDLQKGLNK
jgi:hypothetical protein